MKSSITLLSLSLILIVAAVSRQVAAQEINTQGGQISLGLVPEVRSLQPGRKFSVALHLKHAPAWHTYWKQPGIVGVATRLDWSLPEGFTAGEIQWPPPERVPMASLTAYGYEREVLLMVDITPPDDVEPGTEVTLKAKGAWMACERTCHPGFGDFALRLPVSEPADEPDFDPAWREKFEAERASFPDDLKGWTATVREVSETEIILTLRPNESRETENLDDVYFFSYDNQVDSDAEQLLAILPGGGLEIRLTRPDFAPENPSELAGLIFHPGGWPELGGAKFGRIRASWKAKRDAVTD